MLYKFETKDEKEALRIIKSLDMASVLFELSNIKRKYLKYESLTEEEEAIVEKVFQDIFKHTENMGHYNMMMRIDTDDENK